MIYNFYIQLYSFLTPTFALDLTLMKFKFLIYQNKYEFILIFLSYIPFYTFSSKNMNDIGLSRQEKKVGSWIPYLKVQASLQYGYSSPLKVIIEKIFKRIIIVRTRKNAPDLGERIEHGLKAMAKVISNLTTKQVINGSFGNELTFCEKKCGWTASTLESIYRFLRRKYKEDLYYLKRGTYKSTLHLNSRMQGCYFRCIFLLLAPSFS